MDTTIYGKTDLGRTEIISRAMRLPARLRALLIMIDGKHSIGQLLENHPVPDEARAQIAHLVETGLIAPIGEPSLTEADSSERETFSEMVTVTAADGDLAKIRRTIGRTLIEMIGPDAAFFMPRVRKANTAEAMREEYERLRAMLEKSLNTDQAERFRRRVEPLFKR
ncbi:MAG TPA: hypothetical protein VKY38_10040 [Azoarcus sp.]|nr:hypothetical protein [Azoarcus sp.]